MRVKVGHNRRVRGPSYPDEIIRRARDLRLDGKMPSEIVRTLADEYPDLKPGINTVKFWIKGLRPLGPGRPWDFDKATPAERVLVAPLFAGFPDRSRAVDYWPSQDLADWVVRIRQLRPGWWFHGVERRARLLTHYDRAVADGTGSQNEEHLRRVEIAALMNAAGEDYFQHELAQQHQELEEMRALEEEADTPSRTP